MRTITLFQGGTNLPGLAAVCWADGHLHLNLNHGDILEMHTTHHPSTYSGCFAFARRAYDTSLSDP